METWMHLTEIALIEKYLSPNDIMLEWGAGGSTLNFSKKVKNYYSIEHNKEWFEKINQKAPENVKIFNIPTDQPLTSPTKKEQVSSYVNFIDNIGISIFDKILIDGRGRGWCAEKALDYINENSLVFIHDYFMRPQYHIVENWYEIIDSIRNTPQTLVVLKKK
jgi:hypothetical protein